LPWQQHLASPLPQLPTKMQQLDPGQVQLLEGAPPPAPPAPPAPHPAPGFILCPTSVLLIVVVIVVAALWRIVWQMTGNLKGCLCAKSRAAPVAAAAKTNTLAITKSCVRLYSVLCSLWYPGILRWLCSCV